MTTVFSDLKGIIRNSGLSPEEIAEEAGVSGQTIRNWLTGRVMEADSPSIEAVAKVFGMKLELRLVRARPVQERRAVPRMAVWLRQ